MKIAFVAYEYPPLLGGANTYALKLTQELARLGHEVHVIAPSIYGEKTESFENGVYVHRLKIIHRKYLSEPSYWLKLRLRYSELEKQAGGFDILHASIIGDLSLSNRLVKCPRIVTVHHLAHTVIEYMKPTFLDRLRDFSGELGVAQYLESICIRRANMIITTSAHTKKALTSVYKISPDRIRVIYHGVSEKKYDITDLQKQKICAEYGISNRLVVLFVGRLDARKNIPLLLKAFRDVLKKTDAYLLIVGKGDIPRFQKSAVNYGIEKNVIFAGYVDDYVLELFYSICDVFVLPSVLEGFGIVLTEAMAAGKPIVATNTGAIPEVVINGKNGILVECDNSSALAHAILKFICDKKFAAEVGEQNKKYVAEKFSWERAARETERVYEDVIARH